MSRQKLVLDRRRAALRWIATLAFVLLGVGVINVRADEPKPITLTIVYGDGVEKRFTAIEHRPGMTVLQVMEAAQKHPRGIKFEYRGKGETGFLNQIDDVKNEGRGRNWIFRVNDKLGEESFAVTKVQPGDSINWRFAKYE